MNGLCIQWGTTAASADAAVINFAPNFLTIPSISANLYGAANNTACIIEQNQAYCKIDFAYGTASAAKCGGWVAIGYC